MPLYDYHCVDCDEMFETIRPVAGRDGSGECPVCEKSSSVFLVMTGFASIATTKRWGQASGAERLAGAPIRGPGAASPGRSTARGNVLHVCAGKNCGYCA